LYVVATTPTDKKASYSNYGYGMDIAAPGDNILSTFPNDKYDTLTGTSMAAPNAAGVAALIWSLHPNWSRDQVAAQLLGTADNIDAQNPSYAGLLGAGRVNAYRALTEKVAPPRFKQVLGLPEDGGSTSESISEFQVDVANVFDPATVQNMNNWELRGAGPDGQFDTGDDVIVPLTLNTTYMVGTNRLDFTVDGAMPPDIYQFRAYAGGLADPFGQPLDGNNSGQGGANFVRTFTVTGATGTLPQLARVTYFQITSGAAGGGTVAFDPMSAPMATANASVTSRAEMLDSAENLTETGYAGQRVPRRPNREGNDWWSISGWLDGRDREHVCVELLACA
jgi:hypothetical protein